jgi:hypothetical protein
MSEIAALQEKSKVGYYESAASDSEVGTQALLENQGYTPVRHFFTMVRLNLEDIPDAVIPDGLDVHRSQLRSRLVASSLGWGPGCRNGAAIYQSK